MKRDYEQGETSGVDFFIGTEVENTIYKGLRTLFIAVPLEPSIVPKILRFCQQSLVDGEVIEHLYFGANHSLKYTTSEHIRHFANVFYHFRKTFDVHYGVTDLESIDFLRNLPNTNVTLSFPLPNIQKWDNLTFKLDDSDFNATNNGVWVFKKEELPAQCFNDWSVYSKDKIL